MGFRFRKSVSVGPFRLNASKSGLGWSVGVPGARYTKMANGRTRVTAGIPGMGIFWVEESKKQKTKPKPIKPVVAKHVEKKYIWEKTEEELTGWECFVLFLWDVIKWTFLGLLIAAAVVCVFGIPILMGIAEGSKKW